MRAEVWRSATATMKPASFILFCHSRRRRLSTLHPQRKGAKKAVKFFPRRRATSEVWYHGFHGKSLVTPVHNTLKSAGAPFSDDEHYFVEQKPLKPPGTTTKRL